MPRGVQLLQLFAAVPVRDVLTAEPRAARVRPHLRAVAVEGQLDSNDVSNHGRLRLDGVSSHLRVSVTRQRRVYGSSMSVLALGTLSFERGSCFNSLA